MPRLSARAEARREQLCRIKRSKECRVFLAADLRNNAIPSINRAEVLVVNDKLEHDKVCTFIQIYHYQEHLTKNELEAIRIHVKSCNGKYRNAHLVQPRKT